MQWELIRLRKENSETQGDLAKLLNISESAYRNKERGDSQFKGDEMFIIAKHYNKTIEDIFLPPEYTISEPNKQEA